LCGRLVLITADEAAVDVGQASDGRFGPDPQAVYDEWDAFTSWAQTADLSAAAPFAVEDLGPPVPRPRQVFAIGLNYSDRPRRRARQLHLRHRRAPAALRRRRHHHLTPNRTGSQQTREEATTMALHRLTSVTIGVPNA